MPTGTKNSQLPGCGLHHLSLQTGDLHRSEIFYRDILGMKPVMDFLVGGRKFVMLDIGDGCFLELQAPREGVQAGSSPSGPLAHFALRVEDVVSAAEIIRKAGYAITVEPKDVMLNTLPARVAFACGPDGESIELFQEIALP
jgi:catechol 2,3-dioxygenase-like lactoylglutathione lyase family enzyme